MAEELTLEQRVELLEGQATSLGNNILALQDEKLKIPPFQTAAPSNPSNGDLWIDSDENSPVYILDLIPTDGSTNGVQSGGTYRLINNRNNLKADRGLFSGDFSESATYQINQLVMNGNILYRCVEAITTPESWTNSHWIATDLNTEFNRLRERNISFDMIAENYGTSSSYIVGDYVIHEGTLFKCINNVNNSSVWVPEHWTQVKLANEYSDFNINFSENNDISTLLNSEIPGTTQTVTFNSNGDPISIIHNKNGITIRTDQITWNTNSIIEKRTLTNGKYIIITTNLDTLETIISEITE